MKPNHSLHRFSKTSETPNLNCFFFFSDRQATPTLRFYQPHDLRSSWRLGEQTWTPYSYGWERQINYP